MPPSKRLPCDDPEWIRRKTSIEEMYLFDRLSQKTIREKLEEDGFLVTKSELEAQLRFWNIRKNASKDAWRYVDYMLLKREQQGKDSVVYYNSRKVTRNTLKKERSRYQPGTLTKYITTQSPKTPEGMQLRIRTPTPAPMQSRWPHTLPWLRFQDSVLPTISYLTNQRFYVKLQAPDTKAQIELFSLRQRFGEVPSQTVFNLTVNIASMMPEETENEIPSCAQRMVHGTADQAFNEYFKLILYCLSNNLYTLNDWDVSSWDTVTHLIERSGLINRPLNLAKEKDVTVTSMAETLFKLCIESRIKWRSVTDQTSNSKIISWLLDPGQDPDTQFCCLDSPLILPLRGATTAHDCDLAFELLNAGADATKSSMCNDDSVLCTLLRNAPSVQWMTPEQRETFSDLIRRLLKEDHMSLRENHSASEPSALMLAVVGHDLQIADILIQHGANIKYQITTRMKMRWQFTREISVLGCAVQRKDQEAAIEDIQYLLGHIRQSDPWIPMTDLITPDIICIAAAHGYNDVIKLCCKADHNLVMAKDILFLALCAASYNGHLKTCELLLEYGAPVNRPECLEDEDGPSPLHFAAFSDRFVIVELLCKRGADVNAGFEADHRYGTNNLWNDTLESDMSYRIASGKGDFVYKHCIQCIYVNPLGAAIIGSGVEEKPKSVTILAQYGAELPNWAIYHGAFEPPCPWIFVFAVNQGADLNWRGPDHRTALQAALKAMLTKPDRGYLEVINTLINAGADTNGSEAELIVVLEHWSPSVDILMRDAHGNSGLPARKLSLLAAVFLTRSFSKIQEAMHSCPGAYDSGALCASVMLAITSGSTDTLRQLLNNRPRAVNDPLLEGIALGIAAFYGKMDILNMLLSKIQCSTPALIPVKLEDDPDDPYALEIAPTPFKGELMSIISGSFREYVPIWYRESEFQTQLIRGSPLTLSIWSPECLDKLLESNFCPDRLTISVAVGHGDVKLVEKLVNTKRVDNSHMDRPGPLYLSVERASEEMALVLLKAGIDPNESNYLVEFGRSPLQKAVEDGNLEMIDLLLQAGADVNTPAAKTGGATALQLAAIRGRVGVAKRLVELKANVDASGAETHGRTALEGAAEHGRLDMVQLLLNYGATVVGSGRLQYLKAIRLAELQGHMVMADFLKNLRSWTTFDHEIWDMVNRLETNHRGDLKGLDRLEELITNSAKSYSSNYKNGDSQEETVRLDGTSDYEHNSSLEESNRRGIVVRKEDARVEESPGRLEDSSAATFTGTGHANMIMEDHLVPHICDQSTWNQQVGNAENDIRASWEDSPIRAVHGVHAIQSSEILGIDSQLEWDQQSGWANQEPQASWESMLIGGLDHDVTMEEQVFSATGFEMTWNQQLGIINWNDPQNWLGTEIGSGICHEVLEGDVDWVDTQNPDA